MTGTAFHKRIYCSCISQRKTVSLAILVPSEMTTKRATLSKTFLADIALVRFLSGVSSSMLDQISPGTIRFATELANLRLIARVYPHVNLYVLSCDQFATHLAGHLTLTSVCPHVLLVTIVVKRLKVADLALELFPRFGLAVKFHVTLQVSIFAEVLMTDLADTRLLVDVHAHVHL